MLASSALASLHEHASPELARWLKKHRSTIQRQVESRVLDWWNVDTLTVFDTARMPAPWRTGARYAVADPEREVIVDRFSDLAEAKRFLERHRYQYGRGGNYVRRNPRRNPGKMTLEQAAIVARMIRNPRLRLKPATFEEQLVSTMLDQWEERQIPFPVLPDVPKIKASERDSIDHIPVPIKEYLQKNLQGEWVVSFLKAEFYPIILPMIAKILSDAQNSMDEVDVEDSLRNLQIILPAVWEWMASEDNPVQRCEKSSKGKTWDMGTFDFTNLHYAMVVADYANDLALSENFNDALTYGCQVAYWLIQSVLWIQRPSVVAPLLANPAPDPIMAMSEAMVAVELANTGLGHSPSLFSWPDLLAQLAPRLDAWVVWQHDKGKAR